jgi:prepilin-type N-terminal cleavage/methylation domain-containing protein
MQSRGFTLVELILVIGIMGILAVSIRPVYGNWQAGAEGNRAAEELASLLRAARTKSLSGFNDSEYGIYFDNRRFVLFQGRSYSSRNPAYDKTIEPAEFLEVSFNFAENELYFTKKNGIPSATGTVVIDNPHNKSEKTIFLTEYGMVFLE